MKNAKYLKVGLAAMTIAGFTLPLFAQAYTLTRQLEVGMRGEDVSAVQTFLAQDTSLYPEGLVTGYFGTLTKAAVARFQTRNGISAVGRIGPVTLPVINAQMNGGSTVGFDKSAPMIYSTSISTSNREATINWNTSENASAIVYYSTAPMAMTEAGPGTSVTIYGTNLLVHADLRTTHIATLTGLNSNTTYYYVLYVKDGSGNESISWPASFHTSS